MDKHFKFGLKTMCAWTLFLALIYGSFAIITKASLSGLLDTETGGFISLAFFIAWALIWFAIGQHYSKDYTKKKEAWKQMYPAVNDEEVDKAFRADYFSRLAKVFSF